MKVIGITGSIGSGKTTVALAFEAMGAKVIDADKFSHWCLEENMQKVSIFLKKFGFVPGQSQTTDRQKIANIVFNDNEALIGLCKITHPCVIKKIKSSLEEIKKENSNCIVVLDCPLLLELGLEDLTDYILTVAANRDLRKKRTIERSSLKKDDFIKRDGCQIQQDEKIKKSDFVINNQTTISNLQKQVKEIWHKIVN